MSAHLPVISGGRSAPVEEKLPGIRHVVAVASGKGGVGKSTVAVNLALALREAGCSVGVVDADVLGPSVPAMLGAPYGEPPTAKDHVLLPEERHGVKLISMGLMTDHDSPAILRGPMVSKYIRMFISQVEWGPLDFMLIDLPPGTGDIQLTLAQSIPLSGAIIVTTPQDVSLNIARRGLRMFEKVQVPILGVVENMSRFICPHCAKPSDIFGHGGGKQMGENLKVPYLGEVPLDGNIVVSGDTGRPLLVSHPDSPASSAYRTIANNLQDRVEREQGPTLEPFDWDWSTGTGAPQWLEDATREDGRPRTPMGFRKRDERTLSVLWQDGVEHQIDVRDLRLSCACAVCVNEVTGERVLKPEDVPGDITPKRVRAVGLYAIAVDFSDGHSTGIYSFESLRKIGASHEGFDV